MAERNRQIKRRTILKAAGTSVGAAMSCPRFVASHVFAGPGRRGANDRLTIAHIGVGGMGRHHIRDMVARMKRDEVNIATSWSARTSMR